jgi:ssDNA-binding Zn-finger/Zn-ribbon topoisomerase 1
MEDHEKDWLTITCPKCKHSGKVKVFPAYPQCPKCGYKAETRQDQITG